MRCLLFCCVLASLCRPCLAAEPDVGPILQAYYDSRGQAAPHTPAIKKLSSAEAKEREDAAVWLVAALEQTVLDEKSGAAPWRATPWWGSSGENPARIFRKSVADTLSDAAEVPPAALPVLRWYFEKEFLPDVESDAAKALNKIDSADAAALRRELVSAPHDNALIVTTTLEKMTAAGEMLPLEKANSLAVHHRESIRKAARALVKKIGGEEPPAFDPAAAMRSPPIQRLLRELELLLVDAPPADAPWVVATIKSYDVKHKVTGEGVQTGWLFKQTGAEYVLLTLHGERVTLHAQDKPTKADDESDAQTCSIAPGKIEDEVNRIEAIRRKGAENFEFSRRGGLTGQFEGRGAGIVEILLSQRLHAAGKDDLAARVLLPALDTLYRDADAVRILRGRLGDRYGYEMLVAFAGDRDFARVEKIAKLIAERFPETRFHEEALQFAEEMPKRRDDFVKFKLPKPQEWTELKKKMSRAEQIDFLCARYRLLNYFQMSQPGGYFPGATQYAEPCGMSSNASWGGHKGKTEVINPENELAGRFDFRSQETKGGLELTVKDIPQLSKHLREDWLLPTVTFWRDFHPNRNVHHTRPMIAGLINGLATYDLCKLGEWKNLSKDAVEREIERINQWAAANANRTEPELKWTALQRELDAKETWSRIENRAEYFLKRKDPRIVDVLDRVLRDEKTDQHDRARILRLFQQHDSKNAQLAAARYVTDDNRELRLIAAVLTYQTGDKRQLQAVLGDAVEDGSWDDPRTQAVKLLVADKSPEAKRQAARAFKNESLGREREVRKELFRLCADAGMKEPYAYYLKQLDNTQVAFTTFANGDREGKSTTHAQQAATELTDEFAAQEPAVRDIAKKHADVNDRIPHLKKWLQSKLDAK